ncbi:hypothetical protein [Treponema primitia]|uniref:hypothetical protein n=1 Tax=Treponema primitia TaxID=88058 RepID=UPI000255529F|nr:hypothetical protein [Treponema primitia]
MMKGRLKLTLLCFLAVTANFFLNILTGRGFRLSLFLDTVFSVALTFATGLVPGIAASILSAIIINTHDHAPLFNYFFVLCSIVEVILVWMYCRRLSKPREPFISTVASLLLLYLTTCVVISVLGGLIDYCIFAVASRAKDSFSPEDIFKLGLLRNNVPVLWSDIFSRIPINLIDRFVVIFGGYGVSRLMVRFLIRNKE